MKGESSPPNGQTLPEKVQQPNKKGEYPKKNPIEFSALLKGKSTVILLD